MQVIVSHDVDHLTTAEHLVRDLYVPKAIARDSLQVLRRQIGTGEYGRRLCEMAANKLQYLDEVAEFDLSHGVKPTFFFGMANALGLSYSQDKVGPWLERLERVGEVETGVHGIAYNDHTAMQTEYDAFARISGSTDFGIRMHYLRGDDSTPRLLAKCGYLFDSTEYSDAEPYKHGGLWEVPLQMMDSYEFAHHSTLFTGDVDAFVKRRVDAYMESGRKLLTVNFHDRYFSSAYSLYFDWYQALIRYLAASGVQFVSFKGLIDSYR